MGASRNWKIPVPSLKQNMSRTWKWMVGRWFFLLVDKYLFNGLVQPPTSNFLVGVICQLVLITIYRGVWSEICRKNTRNWSKFLAGDVPREMLMLGWSAISIDPQIHGILLMEHSLHQLICGLSHYTDLDIPGGAGFLRSPVSPLEVELTLVESLQNSGLGLLV